ncbi:MULTISPECIES: hypothetical protein [unclassified Colwellia]|jgi:hypothetical protein|uniref:hypothetical protein n=1 Tax=unclassified Colwellia TaxID=196834 RepID=UPI0015F4D4E0|nr:MULTISPECIES: hypothetical protein [unclassified Colwellia]MBA6357891.1 hypothetical protein [Colwellia sp. BRX8-3]MBA6361672.1 hypothetical protein [Colwellia sp. BRX8-6]MBA6367573.1 hypothetical protein [Colwellia sp. BRX8-5]MBA6375047.1 hypothetical protein [Colwellia sp. BRX8-2]
MQLFSRLSGELIPFDKNMTLPSGLYALKDGAQQIILFDDGSGAYHQDDTDIFFNQDERSQTDKDIVNNEEALNITFDAIAHIIDKYEENSIVKFSHLLPPEVAEFIAPTDLDQAIMSGFSNGVFQTINQRPRMSMRYDVEIMATSRVKRYASNYQAHLVAHSECWQQRTFTGIIPKKLKGQVSEDEIVIYENKVYARLIDNLLRYLASAQARIQQILDVIAEFGELDAQNNIHHYITQITKDWGRAYEAADVRELAQKSKEQMDIVQQYRAKLIHMKNGVLYRSIPQNLQVGIALKPTNILAHDDNYRRLAAIWRTWSKVSSKNRFTPQQMLAMKQQRQLDYTHYVSTIIKQIFADMGWETNTDMTSIDIHSNLSIRFDRPQQGCFEFSHNHQHIARIIVNAEPLQASDLPRAYDDKTFIISPQIRAVKIFDTIVELSPLNLHAKEALSRLIVKSLWRWLLGVFIEPLQGKLPTPIEHALSDNRSIYTPLTQEQTKVINKQANKALVEKIKLKNAIATFVRHCPYCGKVGDKRSFIVKSSDYFKGQCNDRSCNSEWVHDQNKATFFKLNNGGDKDGRFAFSIP